MDTHRNRSGQQLRKQRVFFIPESRFRDFDRALDSRMPAGTNSEVGDSGLQRESKIKRGIINVLIYGGVFILSYLAAILFLSLS